jgi:hypothetical protein
MRAAASLADNRNKSAHVILLERRIPNSPPVLESENLCDHNGAVLVTATLQQKLNTGMATATPGKAKARADHHGSLVGEFREIGGINASQRAVVRRVSLQEFLRVAEKSRFFDRILLRQGRLANVVNARDRFLREPVLE